MATGLVALLVVAAIGLGYVLAGLTSPQVRRLDARHRSAAIRARIVRNAALIGFVQFAARALAQQAEHTEHAAGASVKSRPDALAASHAKHRLAS
jgi:hypothetical protein